MLRKLSGGNWGDEGKGKLVDVLAQDADVVVRYQGGNNAGHTIVNEFGTFKLNLLPSGIFNPRVMNILGPGMVIDLESLCAEIDRVSERGIDLTNIRVSERATICFPYHRLEDAWEEERLGKDSFGSTKRGIAPAYGDRYMKKALQVGDILDPDRLLRRLETVVSWKNAAYSGLYPGKEPFSAKEMQEWALSYADKLRPLICDTNQILEKAASEDKTIIFEAQLGALRDITFGIYPYTSSSSSLSANAAIGGGLFSKHPEENIVIVKAFSSCVGEGPFVSEMDEEEAAELREYAGEYGAATGRPRRIGHFDALATRYGCELQGGDFVAITKIDSLDKEKTLKICTHYEYEGKLLDRFPLNGILEKVTPKYETWPGWQTITSGCRRYEDLPVEARNYIERIEELIGVRIRWVSVGPEREATIER